MEVLGYIAAGCIGMALGLIGGGGSILTVPVLVYLFHIQPKLATSYSLFIVGSTSLAGAITNYLKGWVDIKTALLFGISSITTVFISRRYILPAIPENITRLGTYTITTSMLIMVLFALLMVLASYSMIKNRQAIVKTKENKINSIPSLMTFGILIGLVTGLLGAGAGFLIIPTLVLIIGLPMKEAIGTSLMIIAMNSLLGFTGDLGKVQMDWRLLLCLTTIAIAGIIIGSAIGKKIPGARLKKGFGWFVLGMGIFILIKELIINNQ